MSVTFFSDCKMTNRFLNCSAIYTPRCILYSSFIAPVFPVPCGINKIFSPPSMSISFDVLEDYSTSLYIMNVRK